MGYEINSGKISKAQKIVVYGSRRNRQKYVFIEVSWRCFY